MRAKYPSKYRRTPFADPIEPKKMKMSSSAEDIDVETVPPLAKWEIVQALPAEGTAEDVPPLDSVAVKEATQHHPAEMGDNDPNSPEGYAEYISSEDGIARVTGHLEHLLPIHLRYVEDEREWLEGLHIDSYLCCLRRIRARQSSPIYDTNFVVMSTSLFGYM